MTVVVTTPESTMPFATVAATLMEMKAPTKFRIAATPTAIFGFSAPVAIVVARGAAPGPARGATAAPRGGIAHPGGAGRAEGRRASPAGDRAGHAKAGP